jgi:ABC-type molybdate transport system permease subunit
MRSEKLAAITISSPIALLSVVFLVVVMIAIGVMLNREDNIYK